MLEAIYRWSPTPSPTEWWKLTTLGIPALMCVADVALVDEEMVHNWSLKFSQCALVIIGGGPPCQGVLGLNSDRRGALKSNSRASEAALQVGVMESVASMDRQDRVTMSEHFGCAPVSTDAGRMTWCHRPRLYWATWGLTEGPGAILTSGTEVDSWELTADQDVRKVLEPGWVKVDCNRAFPTFTTARPSKQTGRKPAGLRECQPYELARWQEDLHRFPRTSTLTSTG